jgi:hypothetical protein
MWQQLHFPLRRHGSAILCHFATCDDMPTEGMKVANHGSNITGSILTGL